MSSTPIFAIFLDPARIGGIPANLRDSAAQDLQLDRLAFAAGDILNLQLRWIDFSTSDSGADWQWPDGATIDAVLTIEASLGNDVPTQASAVASFTLASGSPPSLYNGSLDLSGSGVAASIGDVESINAVLDVRVTFSDGHYTYRIPVTLYRAADGSTPTPSGGTNIVNSTNGQFRQRADGRWELYDYGLPGWSEVVLENGVIKFVQTS